MHGGGGGSHAKPARGSSSSSRSSPADNPGKYVGYTLAAVFVVALVAVALFFTYRRKKSKGDAFGPPYMLAPNNNLHAKSGKLFLVILVISILFMLIPEMLETRIF